MPLTGLNDIFFLPFLHWCALHFGTDCKILENTDESHTKELHHYFFYPVLWERLCMRMAEFAVFASSSSQLAFCFRDT